MFKEKNFQKFLKLVIPVIFTSISVSCGADLPDTDTSVLLNSQPIAEIESNRSGPPQGRPENIVITGIVVQLLPDDRKGAAHEQFMIKVTSPQYFGAAVKVAHDLDYAPYVPVKIGDQLELKGDFLNFTDPLVMHWTHRAYNNSPHPDGYIRFNGKIYN
jgi:hypothetical protein